MHKKRQNVIIYTIGVCEIAIHGSNEKMKWSSDCEDLFNNTRAGVGRNKREQPENDINNHLQWHNWNCGPYFKEGEEIMVAQTVKVVNEQGLHMRPAGVFAKEMTKFSCAVTLDVAGKKINAKSVMLIIAACIKCGAEVTVECDGADEKEALAKAVELIESGFGE